MKSAWKLVLGLALVAPAAGCKTPAEGARVKDALPEEQAAEPCVPAAGTWAGRMGMRLADDPQGGALIDCIATGDGLVHIGLHKGDRITGLNRGTAVQSAQSFEDAARTLASATNARIRRWEFTVTRDGQTTEVKPSDEYPGCGVFSFDDCGPLGQ